MSDTQYLDWPFFEARHREFARELDAWAPRLHRQGIICGHDYLLHLDPIWRATGVKRAVDEFTAASDGYDLIVHTRDHGLFILLPRDRVDVVAMPSARVSRLTVMPMRQPITAMNSANTGAFARPT